MSIFTRLIVGFIIILALVLGANVYILFQVFHFKHLSQQLISDNQVTYDQEKMSEYFLSMLRNERQYLYFKDDVFYQYFLKAQKKFDEHFQDAMKRVHNSDTKDILEKIGEIKETYFLLCQKEFKALSQKTGDSFVKDVSQKRKELTDEMIKTLKELRQNIHHEVDSLILDLDRQSTVSIQAIVLTMIFAILAILIVAMIITHSITYPLSLIIRHTNDFARGDFGRKIQISSPPEIKKLAESLNIMAEKLQEVDKMKSEFFALISHELKHPLASIHEGSSLLKEGVAGDLTSKQKKLVNIIQEECKKLINLVNDIMDLSKMEANMMSYNFQEVDIKLIAAKVCKEMEPIFEKNALRLNKIWAEELPKIRADVQKVEQVLRNLLMNAVKFSPKSGEIILKISPEDDGVLCCVKDSGPGIPAEQQDLIFQKFFQIRRGPKAKGTGLGLAIVRHIVEAHGGRVWVESKEGEGSTFYVFLPS